MPPSASATTMPYRAIAYISRAISGLTITELDNLLVDARAHNQVANVTGILLYDGSRFFQYFEGPADGVDRIYGRIRSSTLHHDIQELHNYPIDLPYFTQWNMGCKDVDGSVLQKLSTQQWVREAEQLQQIGPQSDSPALLDLQRFWTTDQL